MLIQFLLVAAVLAVAVLLGRNTRHAGHMAFRRLFLLAFVAAAVLAIAFPDTVTRVAQAVGVGRGADLLLYVLVVAFVGSLAMHARRAADLGRMITLTTRRLALLEAETELRERAADGARTPDDEGPAR